MTLDEAHTVALILDEADGGCPVCADELRKMAQDKFPDFEWFRPRGDEKCDLCSQEHKYVGVRVAARNAAG